jgi:hypothetical protein
MAAVVSVLNHPGHPDQKSHGRKGGQSDLSALSDDELADKFHQATSGGTVDEATLAAVDAEWTRREGPVEAGTDSAPEQEIDRLVAVGQSYRDAYAEVHNMDPAKLGREELAAAIDAQRLPGETRESAVRRLYAETTQLTYLRAESWTNGHMLSPAGRSAGVTASSLFSGQRARARKYASEELKRFWDEVEPRQTYTEFKAATLGRERDKKAAKKIAEQGQEQDFGL